MPCLCIACTLVSALSAISIEFTNVSVMTLQALESASPLVHSCPLLLASVMVRPYFWLASFHLILKVDGRSCWSSAASVVGISHTFCPNGPNTPRLKVIFLNDTRYEEVEKGSNK